MSSSSSMNASKVATTSNGDSQMLYTPPAKPSLKGRNGDGGDSIFLPPPAVELSGPTSASSTSSTSQRQSLKDKLHQIIKNEYVPEKAGHFFNIIERAPTFPTNQALATTSASQQWEFRQDHNQISRDFLESELENSALRLDVSTFEEQIKTLETELSNQIEISNRFKSRISTLENTNSVLSQLNEESIDKSNENWMIMNDLRHQQTLQSADIHKLKSQLKAQRSALNTYGNESFKDGIELTQLSNSLYSARKEIDAGRRLIKDLGGEVRYFRGESSREQFGHTVHLR
ncbi:uncharacterized protein L201_007230 [Kwoniella dendrophila CBS 6074]|uniref:VPS37 C-terminal domain-containing protein n=1 Tax=Kwoniella dendrophila CBS 6074 TaxID=1295534 RepID=A0AAX4K3I2_9TREE